MPLPSEALLFCILHDTILRESIKTAMLWWQAQETTKLGITCLQEYFIVCHGGVRKTCGSNMMPNQHMNNIYLIENPLKE
jgi:hypothetical protein